MRLLRDDWCFPTEAPVGVVEDRRLDDAAVQLVVVELAEAGVRAAVGQ
jgi:hypothetical protein